MYTVIINVPFRRTDPDSCEVASDWGRSLMLLRDSFDGQFGGITVAAPELPPGDGPIGQQVPQSLSESIDDIRFVSLGDARWRARHFWRHYADIRAKCDQLARSSEVVHAGMGNLWQPFAFFGFCAGLRACVTTVFVQDGDMVRRFRDLARDKAWYEKLKSAVYSGLYYRRVKWAVERADLSLLKGRSLHERYGQFARNAKDFYDTSFHASDVIGAADLESKCSGALRGCTLRCLALGRLRDFKGVDHAIRAVVDAANSGRDIRLDIIGDGPDEDHLRTLTRSLRGEQVVRFLGARPYVPELLREIGSYHLLLFTSEAEETPRSLFDAMAGGCALVAYELPFTRQVIDESKHGRYVARGDVSQLTACLCDLDHDRRTLATLMQRAGQASGAHSAEKWYARRAEWTLAAHDRHHQSRPPRGVRRQCPVVDLQECEP